MKNSSGLARTCATWMSALVRLSLGWIFLWAFIDKLFGLGFATTTEKAWINGGSPTYGFLTYGTQGPFAEIFQSMANSVFVEWLFMLGLLGLGLALMLGIMTRIAGWLGAVLMILMWLAILPPENNPFMDDHVVYAFVLIWIAYIPEIGHTLGLGKWWNALTLVKKHEWLR